MLNQKSCCPKKTPQKLKINAKFNGKKKYKVNGKEQKQSMYEGINELTSEAVLEKLVNIRDEQATLPLGLLSSNMSPI